MLLFEKFDSTGTNRNGINTIENNLFDFLFFIIWLKTALDFLVFLKSVLAIVGSKDVPKSIYPIKCWFDHMMLLFWDLNDLTSLISAILLPLFTNTGCLSLTISLVNFKNHENLKVNFSKHVNCFLGDNGVGKTNLLDSIYYLSFCKSYYNSFEYDNVRFGENFFMLKGFFLNNGIDLEIKGSLTNKHKKFKFNEKKYDKLSDHIGKIPVVIITPLDSGIILGGGDERRKFINKLLCQLDRQYLTNLIAYNKTIKQRNALLKDSYQNSLNEDLLLTYDQNLCNLGYQIYLKRRDCIDVIINSVQQYYDFISKKNEHVDIIYKSELHKSTFKDLGGYFSPKEKHREIIQYRKMV